MVISSVYLFFPVSKKIFKLQLIYNKNCKIEHRILYNGHGGLGAGVIQDDKTSEVSLTARLIRKMLVKSLLPNIFILSKFWNHVLTWYIWGSPFMKRIPISASITDEVKWVNY